jgi:dCMP deaminase
MSLNRPDWDPYFMSLAVAVSSRATCPDRQVGCVIAVQNRIVATGYNGAASGLKHCLEVGCQPTADGRCGRALHAEENAICAVARYNGASLCNGVCYVTLFPCSRCARMLIAVGVKRIVYQLGHPAGKDDAHTQALLREGGIEFKGLW